VLAGKTRQRRLNVDSAARETTQCDVGTLPFYERKTNMAMTREEFEAKLGVVLRDHGIGTTADLTDELVAYWTGQRVGYVLINESPSGSSYEEFVMDDVQWNIWRSWLEAWIDSSMFSVRPEVRDWLAEGPPTDAGE
jgi:hypothetical protein